MCEQTSDFLARKLRQNWLNRYPDKPTNENQEQDDSLTNLNWLQNINLTKFATPGAPLSPPPSTASFISSTFSAFSAYSPHSLMSRMANNVPQPNNASGISSCNNIPNKKQYINLYSTGNTPPQRPAMLLHSNRNAVSRLVHTNRGAINQSERVTCSVHSVPNGRSSVSLLMKHRCSPALSGTFVTPVVELSSCSSPRSEFRQSSLNSTAPTSTYNPLDVGSTGIQLQHNGVYYNLPTMTVNSILPSGPYASQRLSSGESNTSRLLSSYSVVDSLDLMDTISFQSFANTHSIEPISNCLRTEVLQKPPNFFYPSLLTRNENRTSNILPVSMDTVDVSTSNLFITLDELEPELRDKYRDDSSTCPPFTFHSLIYMSMQCLKRHKVTLKDIYTWITDNFAFFRCQTNDWQEALRQNLTSSRCFQRVPRRKEEPGGKGDLWRLNPELQSQLVNNKISPKFLHFWHQTADSISTPATRETQNMSSINHSAKSFHHTEKDSSSLNSASFSPLGSLDRLISDSDEFYELTNKRRRMSNSYKCNRDTYVHPVHDTASCSTSSSSPPLSDICTPPPHLVPEACSLSPRPLMQSSKDLIDSLLSHSCEQQSLDQFDVHNFDLESSPPILSQPDELTRKTYSYELSLTNREVDFEPTFINTRPKSNDVDGVVELSKACGLHDIPSLDMHSVSNPLDLTVRGVSLKPSADWWSNNFSDSINSFLNVALCSAENQIENDQEHSHEPSSNPQQLSTPLTQVGMDAVALSTTNIEQQVEDPNNVHPMCSISLSSSLTQCQLLAASPFSLTDDPHWIDEQLNLEELDSILGLT
ncbi:hypothetical protein EG68_05775 [Paragonimus skrjabini miyazakii]|uniref:Fork-head domain-containing protein n=1 Tax=Paragonimus skrjabini miyazakii TaxID=59628 RepID=A0A8S9YQB4_9TREM|nr:hypothetical protein EG68_05775 [Paragonimus skrjabini miyazakii]